VVHLNRSIQLTIPGIAAASWARSTSIHCRVTYTKDRFDRKRSRVEEMLRVVRGDGPLRPDKASELGYPPNRSPLYSYSRHSGAQAPSRMSLAVYAKLLVVPDNDRAEEMAKHFYDERRSTNRSKVVGTWSRKRSGAAVRGFNHRARHRVRGRQRQVLSLAEHRRSSRRPHCQNADTFPFTRVPGR
jgi:hypothetical protein